jgi:hypothetical protein
MPDRRPPVLRRMLATVGIERFFAGCWQHRKTPLPEGSGAKTGYNFAVKPNSMIRPIGLLT